MSTWKHTTIFKFLQTRQGFSKKLSGNFIKNECLALDPRLHSIEEVLKYEDLSVKNETKLYFTEDNLIDELWDNKPIRNYGLVFDHPKNFAGTESSKKLEHVINTLEKSNLDAYFLSSLDSIAWLLNLRGSDILNTPLAFAYLLISQKDKPAILFHLPASVLIFPGCEAFQEKGTSFSQQTIY